MNKYLTIFSLFLSAVSFSQEDKKATFDELKKEKSKEVVFAQKAIVELHDSAALFVRINMREDEIAYYLKHGNEKGAEKTRKKQEEENKLIVEAFQGYHKFSPIYFYNRADSRKLLEYGTDSVVFLNSDLKPDSSINISYNKYYVAEFNELQQDTNSYYATSLPNTAREDGLEEYHYGSPHIAQKGLLLMDRNYVQIMRPFPSFKKYEFFVNDNKKYYVAVRDWNLDLESYYKFVSGK